MVEDERTSRRVAHVRAKYGGAIGADLGNLKVGLQNLSIDFAIPVRPKEKPHINSLRGLDGEIFCENRSLLFLTN